MGESGTAPATGKPVSVSRPEAKPEELIDSPFPEDWVAAAGHSALNEDLGLALLRRRDLSSAAIETLAQNQVVIKQRKILVGIVQHPRTARHVSLPILRRLFIFELMHLALTPAVAADVKLVAEELLIAKLGTISLGECISLARRSSTAVAAAVLLRGDRAVIEAALQNPRMTESAVVKALGKPNVSPVLLTMLTENPKWSLRREIQLAILRRPEASQAVVMQIASRLPKSALQEILKHLRLPEGREYLLRKLLQPKT